MTSRATSIVVQISVALGVIAGVAWWLHGRGHGPDASAKSVEMGRVVPVQLAPVQRKDLPVWIEGLGSIAAFQQVTVHPQVDGRLDKVLFTEGQVVAPGDVLAEIDPRPFIVQLHQAEGALARDRAQRNQYQRDYNRDLNMFKQSLIAKATVDDIAGQVGQADGAIAIDKAAVENAQLQLDYAQVKAPVAGVTGVRQIDAGNIVHATDPNGIVVITAVDPAAVIFTVPQDRLAQVAAAIARGDVPVEVWNRDGTQKLGEGKVAVLDNQINQTTATLRLKALVPNADRTLWPNAFVKARMLVETRKQAIVVPALCVQQGPQGSFVYVVGTDNIVQLKPVTVAFTQGDEAVIDKGLEGSEQVVVEGQNQLRPGGTVAPTRPGKPHAGSAASAAATGAGAGKTREPAAAPNKAP